MKNCSAVAAPEHQPGAILLSTLTSASVVGDALLSCSHFEQTSASATIEVSAPVDSGPTMF
jgi:hypothetical protein